MLNRLDPETFTPCTVLCASNMIGLAFILVFHRDRLKYDTIKDVSTKDWCWLFCGSVLYAGLAPYCFMAGLDTVTVADSAILQRMESINIVVLVWAASSKGEFLLSTWSAGNCVLTVFGIVLTLVSPAFWGEEDKVGFSTGNLLIIASGWANSVSLLISMKTLTRIPVSVIAIYRVFVGTILYHLLVVALGEDLMMLLNPKLWRWIGPYGIIYVFLAQILWLNTIVLCRPLTVSIGMTFQFILTILWSMIILQQLPTPSQWLGFAVISLSIGSSIAEKLHTSRALRHTRLASADEGGGTDDESGLLANLITAQEHEGDDEVDAHRSRAPSRQFSVSGLSDLRVNSISYDQHVGSGFKGF